MRVFPRGYKSNDFDVQQAVRNHLFQMNQAKKRMDKLAHEKLCKSIERLNQLKAT